MQLSGADKFYVGDKAQANREILSLSCPIEEGVIKDWDAIEKVWHHMFHEGKKCF